MFAALGKQQGSVDIQTEKLLEHSFSQSAAIFPENLIWKPGTPKIRFVIKTELKHNFRGARVRR